MILDKKTVLKPILNSANGVHLTVYLENSKNIEALKEQYNLLLNECYEWLHLAFKKEDRKKFLEPLEKLSSDMQILQQMPGNIGLFRTKSSFRIINIPVDLKSAVHVADSFHVKPLLKWMQSDREFMLFGIADQSVYLYSGNRTIIQNIDWIDAKKGCNLDSLSIWMNEHLLSLRLHTKPKVFFAGERDLFDQLLPMLKLNRVDYQHISAKFSQLDLGEIYNSIRGAILLEAKKSVDYAFLEYSIAEDLNLANRNIFQIAKAAVKGSIRKLIIAEGLQVYGKIDLETGGLAIHPFDLDHEDDDILDDLAQAVLSNGGEVIVAPISEIPKGRPILAILNTDGIDANQSTHLEEYENFRKQIEPHV